MLVFVVPGIIAIAAFALVQFVALEYKVPVWNAVKISYELTRNVRIKILGFFMVSCAVIFLGFLMIGLGVVWTLPWSILAGVMVLRELERQTKLPKDLLVTNKR